MGGLPVALLVLLIVVIVAIAIAAFAGLGKSAAEGEQDPRKPAQRGPHVRYRVPEGQDPTVVMTALQEAGYDPVADQGTYEQVVIVPLSLDDAASRDAVRDAIAGARSTNVEGPPVLDPLPVRFIDEEHTA